MAPSLMNEGSRRGALVALRDLLKAGKGFNIKIANLQHVES